MASIWKSVARQVGRLAVREGPRLLRRLQSSRAPLPAPTGVAGRPVATRTVPTAQRARTISYSPSLDGQADPGEVVWTWVAYEEDAHQGKDRPVLVVGREGPGVLLGLMLSSQSHRDGQPGWLSLGTGSWDAEGRPSWVRLDRVLDVPEEGIRREGAVMARQDFDVVAARLRADHGWR
ncbi:type II toxin-antitoxin system PemK/MazF family toxin [Rhodococcus sp. X156]|uniref:type II toxin-antitoxin system PemK/MazF family toxin n=1 Tax=Rhodococcus sp. X156 TaxID=2499145 RepID=UPI000FDA4B3C|nr:type II toxin-antitoxin system PemK/MazF family toxin [Rhodococcus sp. X156]